MSFQYKFQISNLKKIRHGGFTLLELIVVLFIVGVAAAAVTVSIGRAQKNTAVRDSMRMLHSTLRQARDTALLERAPVAVMLDEENMSYWLEKNEAQFGNVVRMPEGVELEGRPIVFYPKGNSTGGRIHVRRSDGKEYLIEVDAVTGLARVEGFF